MSAVGDGRQFGRLTSDEPARFYMRDSENTVNFHPLDYLAHKGWSAMKIANMGFAFEVERRKKYMSQAHCAFKSEVEL